MTRFPVLSLAAFHRKIRCNETPKPQDWWSSYCKQCPNGLHGAVPIVQNMGLLQPSGPACTIGSCAESTDLVTWIDMVMTGSTTVALYLYYNNKWMYSRASLLVTRCYILVASFCDALVTSSRRTRKRVQRKRCPALPGACCLDAWSKHRSENWAAEPERVKACQGDWKSNEIIHIHEFVHIYIFKVLFSSILGGWPK